MNFRVMNAIIGNTDYLDMKGYIYEPKLDGYRALCVLEHGKLKFISRNNNDLTDTYPELHFPKNIKAQSAVLDGEIVAFDTEGNPSFTLLQQGYKASYIVFDILMKNGKSITNEPLLKRKEILASTVNDGQGIEKIFYTTQGQALWKEIQKRKLEGVMAKRVDGLYYEGQRTAQWIKIKLLNTIDCVIVGYLPGKRALSSLALGLYNEAGNLTYIGNVGTGFTYHMIDELLTQLKKLIVEDLPLQNKAVAPKASIWVQPKLVAEIKYLEMTPYGILRAPVFLRLRKDKRPQECTFKDQLP